MTRFAQLFSDSVEEWSPDDYILRFWEYSCGYVANHHSGWSRTHDNATVDDLVGVAIETLVTFARDEFPAWTARNHVHQDDSRLFWAMCRSRINWAIQSYIRDRTDVTEGIPERDEEDARGAWTRYQNDHHQEHSELLKDLASRYRTLPPGLRAVLALYYFEEFTQETVAEILGFSRSRISIGLQTAEDRVLHHAISLAAAAFPPTPQPDINWTPRWFDTWVREAYDCTADAYLEYVTACFTIDVSYLVDILRAANGDRIIRVPANDRRKLTPEQVDAVWDRLNAGEPARQIAASLDVTEGVIIGIKTNRTYQDTRVNTIDTGAPRPVSNRKLTDAQVRDIRTRLEQGEMGKDLAAEYGVSRPTISEIKNGRYHRNVMSDPPTLR